MVMILDADDDATCERVPNSLANSNATTINKNIQRNPQGSIAQETTTTYKEPTTQHNT